MARLNGAHPNLLRIKAGVTADADYTDPSVPIPGFASTEGTLISDDPTLAKAWSIQPRRADGTPLTKVKIKVTLRTSAGVEVAGTWTAIAYAIAKQDEREGKASLRPGVEWLGVVTAQPTMKPAILDIASFDMMGLAFTEITGTDVAFAYVYVQEWA